MNAAAYSEETIRTLDWREHIRKRPGMYIGKLGDGSSQDDGIYVLIKEVLDNSVDEFMMGLGKVIDIVINENVVKIQPIINIEGTDIEDSGVVTYVW